MSETAGSEQALTLRVGRMTYGPDAIARTDDGKAVFVRGAVPGDLVRARVTREQPTYSNAVLEEVLEASPERVSTAPCPFVDVCGGCPWAHLSREAQLRSKRDNVVDSLVRIGHMPQEEADGLVRPCSDPGDPWGYRNKVELAFQAQGRRSVIGMHDVTGDRVVKVDRCPLLQRGFEKVTKSVSGALSYLSNSRSLQIDRVGVRASRRTRQVEVALWTQTGGFPRAQAAKILREATGATSVVRVLTKGPQKARKVSGLEKLGGYGSWEERVGSESMLLSAPSFFQVNTRGAEELVRLVMEGLDPVEDECAMDLYSGAGTFTLPLARRCDWVDAVESYGPAVRDLRRNLERTGLDNVDPVGGDADLEFPDADADVIVVDPPRAGLAAGVVQKLSAQPARAIAYVSCDPATLARDLARFAEEGTFSPVWVTPVDLFPQTFHVETVTLLQRVRR